MAQIVLPSSVSSLCDAFKPEFRAQRPELVPKQDLPSEEPSMSLISHSLKRLKDTQGI